MKGFIALVVLQFLLIGAESFGFNDHDDYVHRNICIYGFNGSNDNPINFKQKGSPQFLEDAALLYFQLDGVNDTVRYVWSLVGTPTLFMSVEDVSVSDPTDRLSCQESVNSSFDWKEFYENQTLRSAHIPGYEGDFAVSLIFNRLIEFKDSSNKANKAFNASDLGNNETYRPYNLSGLEWTFDYGKMQLVAREQDLNTTDKKPFTWTIQLRVPTTPGRVSQFPKTLYTVNSTVFDFVFSNFKYTLEDKDNGRLVLEMQLVHGTTLQPGKLQDVFSRDDEYTPSVFITYNQLFDSPEEDTQGYLQWKPISYLSPKRKSTQSQQALSNQKVKSNVTFESISSGLVLAQYNETEAGIIKPIYMVFGTEGDDNNPRPSYVSWTGLLGFGTPPQDSISFVVILTICIGLGVPALLIALGGVFLVIRRKPWKKLMGTSNESKGYQKLDINDDTGNHISEK